MYQQEHQRNRNMDRVARGTVGLEIYPLIHQLVTTAIIVTMIQPHQFYGITGQLLQMPQLITLPFHREAQQNTLKVSYRKTEEILIQYKCGYIGARVPGAGAEW